MKTLIYQTKNTDFKLLQPLHNELKSIGISNFDIDFEHRRIVVTCPHHLENKLIECALIKAGFKCPCLSLHTQG